VLGLPLAHSRTIRARRASACALLGRRAQVYSTHLRLRTLALGAISLLTVTRSSRFTQVASNPQIRIDIHDLQPGQVHFFAYRNRAGEQIRFLLARDSTGQTKAAFDACQRCYIYHRGYVSSDGNLICRYCGNRYRLETMESGLASCAPVKLPIHVVGQTVSIKSADLERERGLF
jgi:uncharacterized membrane protein